MEIKSYKKSFDHSYCLGVFTTLELLLNKPNEVIKILLSEKGEDNKGILKILNIAKKENIEVEFNGKLVDRISKKENTYVIGVFKKYTFNIKDKSHLVLVNPSDMGNMGTIIRTALGMNIKNIAIIKPSVDIFNPKVIRASMGSIFKLNIEFFESFEEYRKKFLDHKIYSFVLNGKFELKDLEIKKEEKYSLVFGNEGQGLDEEYFENISKTVKISQTDEVDSLNLGVAVGIGLYKFMLGE